MFGVKLKKIVAYARTLNSNSATDTIRTSGVIIHSQYRVQRLVSKNDGLSAQSHLISFYVAIAFTSVSSGYL